MNFCDHILELETSQPRQLCCFQNLKFEKIAKNYKIKIFKNLFHSFFAYWHTDHVCQVSWESRKNCRRCSDLKKLTTHTQTNTSITYTISSANTTNSFLPLSSGQLAESKPRSVKIRISHCHHFHRVSTSLCNCGLCWTVFARNRDTAVNAEGNGDLQTLICVLVARPRRCLTLSNPVPWQNWIVAYLSYTLRMKMLFCGWPVMVHNTHTRRRRRPL